MTILHNFIDDSTEDYNESNRKVLLHQHATGYDTAFTIAAMADHYVSITRMNEDSKPKTMRLSDVEVEALVVAWTTFKADIETAKAAKIAQEQRDLQSALSLAREMREHLGELGTLEIKVDHSSDHDTYRVSLPSVNRDYYNHQGSGYTIHNGTDLLKAVKSALGKVRFHVEAWKHAVASGTWQQSPDKEKAEGYIATWDAAQPWLEQVKAEHFPKAEAESDQETTPEKTPSLVQAPGNPNTVTWTLHLTNTALNQ